MQLAPALHELRQRIHAARKEDRPSHELSRLDEVLLGMDEGLYPVCAKCGERIEMERLMKNPAERECWSCVAHGSAHAACCKG